MINKHKYNTVACSQYLPKPSLPFHVRTPRVGCGEVQLLHNVGWTNNSPAVFETGTVMSGVKLRVHQIVPSRQDYALGCVVGHMILSAKKEDIIDADLCSFLPSKIYFVLYMSQMHDKYSRTETTRADSLNNKGRVYEVNDMLGCDVMVRDKGVAKSLTFNDEGHINPSLCVEVCSRERYVTEAKKFFCVGDATPPSKLLLPILLPTGNQTYIAQVQECITTADNSKQTGYIVHFSACIFGFVQCEEIQMPSIWDTIEVGINVADLLVEIPSCIGIEKYHTDVMFKCIHQAKFNGDKNASSSEEDNTTSNKHTEYTMLSKIEGDLS